MDPTKPTIMFQVTRKPGETSESDSQTPGSPMNNDTPPGLKIKKSVIYSVSTGDNIPGLGTSDPQSTPDSAEKDKGSSEELGIDNPICSPAQALHPKIQQQNSSSDYTTLIMVHPPSTEQMKMRLYELNYESMLLREKLVQDSAAKVRGHDPELSTCGTKIGPAKNIHFYQKSKTKESMNQSGKKDSESKIEETEEMDTSDKDAVLEQEDSPENLKKKIKEQEREIAGLHEVADWLERQMRKKNYSFSPTTIIYDTDMASFRPGFQDRRHFNETLDEYKTALKFLSSTYDTQVTRYLSMQDHLRKAIDVMQDLKDLERKEETAGSDIEEKKNQLSELRSKLEIELTQKMKEMEELIEAQNQFQNILSDYSFILNELEITREENTKLILHQPRQQDDPPRQNLRQWLQLQEEQEQRRQLHQKSLDSLQLQPDELQRQPQQLSQHLLLLQQQIKKCGDPELERRRNEKFAEWAKREERQKNLSGEWRKKREQRLKEMHQHQQ